jgi:hypothetical protein
LFQDLDKYLATLIEETQKLVEMFNDSCIEEIEKHYRIGLEEVGKSNGQKITEQTTYLVDIAKAEALDTMGENRAAVELVERYLEN